MRMVMGVSVIVTISSGMSTVRVPEKIPSAQKSPHGDRPKRDTTWGGDARACDEWSRGARKSSVAVGRARAA